MGLIVCMTCNSDCWSAAEGYREKQKAMEAGIGDSGSGERHGVRYVGSGE